MKKPNDHLYAKNDPRRSTRGKSDSRKKKFSQSSGETHPGSRKNFVPLFAKRHFSRSLEYISSDFFTGDLFSQRSFILSRRRGTEAPWVNALYLYIYERRARIRT